MLRADITYGGKEVTTGINPENEITTSIRSMFSNALSREYIQALEDSELVVIPFQQLRSIHQWAYAERIGNLIDKGLHPDHNEYTIFLANTEQLFKNSVLGEVGKDNLFTGHDKNDTRIAMLLYRWESGLPVDPPTIGFRGKPDNSIVFADGRHRTKLTYGYNRDGDDNLVNNRLRHVKDAIDEANYKEDIDNQGDDNYGYDEIGNLVRDDQENITGIEWSVYGKILSITRTPTTEKPITKISYSYDAAGNRLSKTVEKQGSPDIETTWYVRDASGNVMALYTHKAPALNTAGLKLTEHHLYGSSRLGIWNKDLDMDNAPTGVDNEDLVGATMLHTFRRGQKFFELSNHLGNVLVTISDRKALQTWDDGTANGGCAPGTGVEELSVDTRGTATSFVGRTTVNVLAGFESGEEDNFEIYTDEELDACVPVEGGGSSEASVYTAEIVSANDYYPFGMLMPGRSYAVDGEYRYGFNGKENDNEVKGHGVQQDYGMRIYDTRLGKFLSVDPLTKGYPFLTPYQFASNIPTAAIDIDGEESGLPLNGIGASGKPLSEYFLTAEGRKSWAKAMGTGLGVGGAVMLDIFVTKGYITKTLLASQGLGLFEHNIGKTPEQRKAQLERFRENSLDFLKNVAGGYVINKLALGIIALGSESRKLYNFGMKALGEMGEESLALQYGTIKPSGKGSSMSTSLGPRKPAGIPVGTTVKSTDKLYESKVGFQNYEGDVIKQVLKDKELLATGQVQEITWVFYRSPNTGKVGASEELLKELGVGGIKTEIAGDIPKNILQKAIEKYAPTTKN